MENKCEKLGFQHAWEHIEDSRVFLTYPPQYPNKREKCINCNIIRELVTKQSEIKEWQYEPRESINSSVDTKQSNKD